MGIGGITYKTINGKRYAYYQWTENGKQRSRRVKDDEFAELSAKIAAERAQKASLRGVSQGIVAEPAAFYSAAPGFKTDVKVGPQLSRFFEPVMKWKKRECFAALHNYIYGENNDRVLILYGLRRTGKTTLVRQLMGEMPAEVLSKTAFVQLSSRHSLADVNHDLKLLESLGYRYVFVDEVTMLGDFIEGAALFSDVFAASGMKVVLSGTDSLGFVFSEDEQLYDRCILLHTTFIPYREFESVLGVAGIDRFIEYGGTMSMGGSNYNTDKFTFATKKSADEYVDSAIARNIQHSLKCYQHEGHFRSLQELYDAGELTGAINRIVEMHGGQVVVSPEEMMDIPLPIGGLMAPMGGHEIAFRTLCIQEKVKEIGCTMKSPFITMAFMCLPVIPDIKITDRHLMDTKNFKVIY